MSPTVTLNGREYDCSLDITTMGDLGRRRRVYLCPCGAVQAETDLHGDDVLKVTRLRVRRRQRASICTEPPR